MMVNNNNNNSSNQQQHGQLQQQQQQQFGLVGGHNANHLLLTSLSAMPNLLTNPNLMSLNAAAAVAQNNSTTASSSASSTQQQLNQVNMNGGGSTGVDLQPSTSSGGGGGNTGLLDLIMCKLVAPFHVVNDPRLLECGSSACYQCIMSSKDAERALKCPYCSGVHKIPVDSSKLIVNKNLQNFLKTNSRHINANFSKQLEDSMFALEQKIHSQNLSMENFDQYLTLIQNDVQMKVDTMKSYLEKYGQHFIENLKSIRKEVQKQWIEHSQQTGIPTSNNSVSLGNMGSLSGNLNGASGKDKSFPLLGLKPEALFQQANMSAVLTSNGINNNNNNQQPSYQLNSFTGFNVTGSTGNNNNNSNHLNSTSNDNKHRNSNANHSNNNNNFSNSSWNANDDDLDDFDGELNLKSGGNSSGGGKRHLNKEQAQFNKFVREEVAKKFGEDFLLQHEVNQLESSVMELIKSEAISTFLPKDTTPARAWTLAKVSLRSLKRDLRRKQSINPSVTIKRSDSMHDTGAGGGGKMVHPYFDI